MRRQGKWKKVDSKGISAVKRLRRKDKAKERKGDRLNSLKSRVETIKDKGRRLGTGGLDRVKRLKI